jgi:hypothetical protein
MALSSEFLRADYRGGAAGRISAYQRMNLFTLLYYMAVFPQSAEACT